MANQFGQQSFRAQVEAWVTETQERLVAVFREAALRVIAEMQAVGPSVANPGSTGTGHMPVDTGFLRSSLTATLNDPATGIHLKPKDVRAFQYNEGQVSLVILGAKIGDTIYAVYTAAYARRMEYGFSGTDSLGRSYNQEGYGFVRLAAQRWQDVVNEVVADVRRGG